MVADPRELTNIWDDTTRTALRSELMAGLLDWMVVTSDVTPMHTDARGPPAYPTAASECAVNRHDGPE